MGSNRHNWKKITHDVKGVSQCTKCNLVRLLHGTHITKYYSKGEILYHAGTCTEEHGKLESNYSITECSITIK